MTYNIVGLGDSARNWDGTGLSIGVNDAWRWGHPTTCLLVVNAPSKFSPERLRTIIESKPKYFYSHKSYWADWFNTWKRLNLVAWYGTLNKNQYYTADSSPFVAMTLAYNLGATKIILWGVDLINHHLFNSNNPQNAKEIERYRQLTAALREKGVEVYLGAKGSALESFLTVYKHVDEKRN